MSKKEKSTETNQSKDSPEDKTIASGAIGRRIKRYRVLSGLTQRELGLECGFPYDTARIKINHFEKGVKIPTESELLKITKALKTDRFALSEPDLAVPAAMVHALLEIEDYFGLCPVEIKDDEYCLVFDDDFFENKLAEHAYSPYMSEWYEKLRSSIKVFLREWHEMRKKCLSKDKSDTKKERAAKLKEYARWKAKYSLLDEHSIEQVRDDMRERAIKKELKEIEKRKKERKNNKKPRQEQKKDYHDAKTITEWLRLKHNLLCSTDKYWDNKERYRKEYEKDTDAFNRYCKRFGTTKEEVKRKSVPIQKGWREEYEQSIRLEELHCEYDDTSKKEKDAIWAEDYLREAGVPFSESGDPLGIGDD